MAVDSAGLGDPLSTIRQRLHDLNNQLALVVGGAELLVGTPTLPDDVLELVTAILDGAEQASRIAADVQGIVRAAASTGRLASVR